MFLRRNIRFSILNVLPVEKSIFLLNKSTFLPTQTYFEFLFVKTWIDFLKKKPCSNTFFVKHSSSLNNKNIFLMNSRHASLRFNYALFEENVSFRNFFSNFSIKKFTLFFYFNLASYVCNYKLYLLYFFLRNYTFKFFDLNFFFFDHVAKLKLFSKKYRTLFDFNVKFI